MTPIVELRKELRAVDKPTDQFRRSWQMPTAHIPASVLKILGLKSAD